MFLEAEGPQNPMGPDTPSDYRIGQPVKDRTGTYVLDTIQNGVDDSCHPPHIFGYYLTKSIFLSAI